MGWIRDSSKLLSSRSSPLTTRPSRRDFSGRGSASIQQINSSLDTDQRDTRVRLLKKNYYPRQVIFSGIQPTGIPHLGNYLGALRQWKQFQDEKARLKDPKNYRLIYSIVDLHALTHQQDAAQLLQRRNETLASLLAIGLNPKHSSLTFQSSIREHASLMWYLSNVASTGYLSRMTQWKSKLGVSEKATIEDKAARENLRLGLFSYPVLQAADILLYGTDLVPVGEDQLQHVEFTRTLARSFNAQYREANNGQDFFKIPKALISPAKRIMSLKDPTTKMSKSDPNPNSRILITDSPDDIRSKIKGAVTDSIGGISYDPKKRPGVSNLIEILKHVSNEDATCQDIAADHATQNLGVFKEYVSAEIIKCLAGFRDQFIELMDYKNDKLNKAAIRSYHSIAAYAGNQMAAIETLMGLKEPHMPPNKKEALKKKENKRSIMREQEEEQEQAEDEPDVIPQQDQGVDRPIAS